jgi:hypothetical protein
VVLTRLGKIADRSAAGGDRPLGATEGHRQPPDVEKILGASRDQVKPIEPGGRQDHPLDRIRIPASPTDAGRDAIRRRVDRYCNGAGVLLMGAEETPDATPIAGSTPCRDRN